MTDREALERADRIIGWMASYLGRMAPPSNGLFELNEHWLFMESLRRKPAIDTSAKEGRPLDQPAVSPPRAFLKAKKERDDGWRS